MCNEPSSGKGASLASRKSQVGDSIVAAFLGHRRLQLSKVIFWVETIVMLLTVRMRAVMNVVIVEKCMLTFFACRGW